MLTGRLSGQIRGRLTHACLAVIVMVLTGFASPSAHAQVNFDRPGGDYSRAQLKSGDPAECALLCERDRRCRSWSFVYPRDPINGAACWLKNSVPQRQANTCCVTGIRGAGVLEPRKEAIEPSIDRFGGDYRNFEVKTEDDAGDDVCKAACAGEQDCRAWTFARSGYVGRHARCFLKKDIKPPLRRPGFVSGVIR